MSSLDTRTCLFIVVLVCASALVQSISLGRTRLYHDYEEDSVSQDLPRKNLNSDSPKHQPAHTQTKRRGYVDHSSIFKYEEELKRGTHGHRHSSKSYDHLHRRKVQQRYNNDDNVWTLLSVRRKRHNHNKYNIQNLNQQRTQSRLNHHKFSLKTSYDVEVRKAQNSSLCNYTVEPVPDPTNGTRKEKNLEHVRCNYLGSKCLDNNDEYCCIQTYKMIKVSYENGITEDLRLYVGCVCATELLLEETTLSSLNQ